MRALLVAYLPAAPAQAAAVISAALLALATTILGGPSALALLTAGSALVLLGTAHVAGDGDRMLVTRLVGAMLATRILFMLLLHVMLLPRGGGMFQDDFGYPVWAHIIARRWQGEPVAIPADSTVLSSYLYLAASVTWLLGPSVVALKLLNVVMAVGAAVLLYRVTRTLAGRRAGICALVMALAFPSLVLWSSLVLKDSFVLLLALSVVLTTTEFVRSSKAGWLLVAMLAAFPLQNTREYLYIILVMLWPVAAAVRYLTHRRPTLGYVALALLAAVSFLTPEVWRFTPDAVATLDTTRGNMAEGARSAFIGRVETVTKSVGEAFVVTDPNVPVDPSRTPNIVAIAPGTRIVTTSRAGPDAPAGTVTVRSGDVVVVVVSAPPTPQPTAPPTPMAQGGTAVPVASPLAVVPAASVDPLTGPYISASVTARQTGAAADSGPRATGAAATRPPAAAVATADAGAGAPATPKAVTVPAEAPATTAEASASHPAAAIATTDIAQPLTSNAASSPPLRSVRPAAELPRVAAPVAGALVVETPEEAADLRRRIWRSLGHLPVGLVYVLGAPFPWTLRTPTELALLPELMVWYVTVALSLVGLVQLLRARASDAAYVTLVGAAIAAVLALVEGNLGTLVRHRAMLIPFAIVLASTGLAAIPPPWLDRAIALLSRRPASRLRDAA